jgi:hypothetical protein
MYNRYIRAPDGGYTRVPQHDDEPPRSQAPPHPEPPPHAPPPPHDTSFHGPPPPRDAPHEEEKESDFISRLLGKLHLDDIDSGDLLVLLLLFFLFRQDADEELLVALGLLLIL